MANISYSVIFFEFDPKTDTDYVSTRIELEPTSTLDKAVQKQKYFLSMLKTKKSYRSYIQKRENYIVRQTARKTITGFRVLDVTNFLEVKL